MFFNTKKTAELDTEQHELFEHARKRMVQKKMLFRHFIVFLIGALFCLLANLVLGIGNEFRFLHIDWSVYLILIWAFLFSIHFCNVWLFSTFMGQAWTDKQMERLVAKQKLEIANLQKEVDLMHPKKELLAQKNDPETPQL